MGLSIFRRISAILIALVLMTILMIGAQFRWASSVVNSSTSTSTFLLSIVTPTPVATALAAAALNDVEQHSSATVAAAIQSDHVRLQQALVTTIQSPATQKMVRIIVAQVYTSFKNGTTTTVDLRPLVSQFTSALHKVNSAVPAAAPFSITNYKTIVNRKSQKINLAGALGTVGTVLTVIGCLGAILIARFMVRNRTLRLVMVGSTIGLPGLLLLGFGLRLNSLKTLVHDQSATAKVLINNSLSIVGKRIENSGLVLIVIAVAVVIAWIGCRMVNDRRIGTPSAISVSSMAPVPSIPPVSPVTPFEPGGPVPPMSPAT